MRVLTWNLFHGRAVPPAHRDLCEEFAAALARWDWDVALLQEVPPWWPPLLGADAWATALTSRNACLPLRKAIAQRWPDLIKSGGGSANAVLVRGDEIVAQGRRRLRLWPERRVAQAVLLGSGTWVGNLHAQVHSDARARADFGLAARWLLERAGDGPPVVLGGDFNVREPTVAGMVHAGGRNVDHVFARGLEPAGHASPPRHGLSDHDPVIVTLRDSG
ncbi:MAG TPA: endonuclease/exonuclease/phosphatase family protein [Capillimicrobium sp.]